MMRPTITLDRRTLIKLATAQAMALGLSGPGHAGSDWYAGELCHLLPSANHDRFLVKASFTRAVDSTPVLTVNGARFVGIRSDTAGRFWQFHVSDLDSDTRYRLQLIDGNGQTLCDPWPLKTFPAPESEPTRLRILAFTCAGGNEALKLPNGIPCFLSLAERRALLARGLSFQPDVVIANGDHLYWDQKTVLNKPAPFRDQALKLYAQYGSLDPSKAVLGTANEDILTGIADPQIAHLYGTLLRSTPVMMLTDDHDLFENDEASDTMITLPPDAHRLEAARATQYLYYPEFLPDSTRPPDLAGASAADRAPGLSEVYGTLRYGRLFEGLLYDTKRFSTVDGEAASVIPLAVESWLATRTAATDVAHLFHMPSTPIGWSAGKWGEWYPDVLEADGTLGQSHPKAYWPTGWWLQHQRLLAMLGAQTHRPAVIASGDLHAFAGGRITRSAELDLSGSPIHSFCVGPLGSAGPGFPSAFRGIGATVPTDLTVEEAFKPLEKNGFSIIDVSRERIRVAMYAWRPPEPISGIEHLEPMHIFDINA